MPITCTHKDKVLYHFLDLNERDRLKLQLLFLLQWYFNQPLAVSEFSKKNRCSGYNNINECHLFFSKYLVAGLKYYWIRNDDFHFSLSLS